MSVRIVLGQIVKVMMIVRIVCGTVCEGDDDCQDCPGADKSRRVYLFQTKKLSNMRLALGPLCSSAGDKNKNKNKNKNSLLSKYIEIHWKLLFSAH